MSASAHQRITGLAALTAVHRAFHWLHLHQLQLRQWLWRWFTPAPPFESKPAQPGSLSAFMLLD